MACRISQVVALAVSLTVCTKAGEPSGVSSVLTAPIDDATLRFFADGGPAPGVTVEDVNRLLISDYEQKGLLAALYLNSRSPIDIKRLADSKTTPISIKMLAAWKKLAIAARGRIISREAVETAFSEQELDFFRSTLKASGYQIPAQWNGILSSGKYLANDLFDTFAKASPHPSLQSKKVHRKHRSLRVKFDREEVTAALPQTLDGFELVDAIECANNAVLLFRDEQQLWKYRCVAVSDSAVVWNSSVQSYWVAPKGGGTWAQLSSNVGGATISVYCATPISIAVDSYDVKTGNRVANFSSLWAPTNFFEFAGGASDVGIE